MKITVRSMARMATFRAFPLLFVIASVAVESGAATYYVGQNGAGEYTCSQAQSPDTPLPRITDGIQCLSAGDTLIVGAGLYSEMVGDFMYIPSGTPDNPITLMANPGDTVIIEAPYWMPHGGVVLDFQNLHFITLKGFIIDGGGIAGRNVVVGYPSTNITIEDNEIRGALYNGVFVDGESNVILNNSIHSNGLVDYSPFQPPYGYGIYLLGGSNLIDGNDIYNNGRYGIHGYSTYDTLNYNIIRNNLIHDNEQGAGGAGILMSGVDNLIYGNTIWNEIDAGIVIGFGAYPYGIQIYNNTIYSEPYFAIMVLWGEDIEVFDNIFIY